MFQAFVLISFIHFASAAVYVKSHCPHIKAVENFDMQAYGQGQWYEIARYPNEIEKRGDCVSTIISYENGRYKFKSTEILDGHLENLEGYYELAPDAGNAGIINVHSPNTTAEESNSSFPLYYVDIDYDNYVIMYECSYNEETQTRHDYVWIMSRSKKLNEKSRIAVENFVKSTGYIDLDKFEWDHFTKETCSPE